MFSHNNVTKCCHRMCFELFWCHSRIASVSNWEEWFRNHTLYWLTSIKTALERWLFFPFFKRKTLVCSSNVSVSDLIWFIGFTVTYTLPRPNALTLATVKKDTNGLYTSGRDGELANWLPKLDLKRNHRKLLHQLAEPHFGQKPCIIFLTDAFAKWWNRNVWYCCQMQLLFIVDCLGSKVNRRILRIQNRCTMSSLPDSDFGQAYVLKLNQKPENMAPKRSHLQFRSLFLTHPLVQLQSRSLQMVETSLRIHWFAQNHVGLYPSWHKR